MTALSERPFPSWSPRFGERLVNVCKGEDDPHRVATFVRVRRVDRITRWEMTNERGSFWLVEPRAMERLKPVTEALVERLTNLPKPGSERDAETWDIGHPWGSI